MLTTQDVSTQWVLRLINTNEGNNQNVNADNSLSSIELINELVKPKVTYVGGYNETKMNAKYLEIN